MNLKGLTSAEVEESRKNHGSNKLTQIPTRPLWKIVLNGFTDPMILILLVALAVQLVLCFMGQAEWYEPVGVLVAILIANGVASVSQYKQEGKASALKSVEEAKETAKVLRDGKLTEIHVSEVVVGDIVYLQAGDKISADGEIVEGTIAVDQASLNGETEEAEKRPVADKEEYEIKDLLNEHYAYRGTVVCGGEAYMEVKVVGDKTIFGELALEVQEDKRATPLQIKLAKLANQISTFGYIGASLIVIAKDKKTLLSGQIPANSADWVKLLIDAVTVAITIIVCAVPEGLPMLTSVLLSYQSIRMAKDNVLVRNINGLETAGSLSILFTDKTGTITEGKLSVSEISIGTLNKYETVASVGDKLRDDILIGIGVNNSSSASDGKVLGGNNTDRALMSMLIKEGYAENLPKGITREFIAFDSAKKYSGLTYDHDGKTETYIKGAPEKILIRCKYCLDENGQKVPFDKSTDVNTYIEEQALRSMRLLAVAKSESETDDGELTLICILSIRDNVRKEAADAIREVKAAGIQVVMITGDRKETAVAIAKDAGLLSSRKDIALTSAELASMDDDEVKRILPNLRVVSRALPTDKSRLVRIAQELDLVVGMTGDGVNDSPALKKADVGFAMGSGTEVAKAAGDITILDDNFLSIEKAILYGRTMFKSIRKFLIFQLTVNVAAVLTCFIGPIIGNGPDYNIILTVVQLLLINLAMDTLAAIAYGSEPALRDFMKDKPIARRAGIITGSMAVEILVAALYITLVCLGILFFPPLRDLFGEGASVTYLKSALFATFMMAITFNGFNARTEHFNIFDKIGLNKNFIVVLGVILISQFVFVTFGGSILSVEALSPYSWAVCALLAVLVIPIDLFRKLIVRLIAQSREEN